MFEDPLTRTFEVLATSSRGEADELLVTALCTTDDRTRILASDAIHRRGSIRGLIELIRRFDELPDDPRRRLSEPSDALTRALGQCLRQGDPAHRAERSGGRPVG